MFPGLFYGILNIYFVDLRFPALRFSIVSLFILVFLSSIKVFPLSFSPLSLPYVPALSCFGHFALPVLDCVQDRGKLTGTYNCQTDREVKCRKGTDS